MFEQQPADASTSLSNIDIQPGDIRAVPGDEADDLFFHAGNDNFRDEELISFSRFGHRLKGPRIDVAGGEFLDAGSVVDAADSVPISGRTGEDACECPSP